MIFPTPRPSALPAVAFLLFQLVPGVILAEVYKWTDSNGRVHYGDAKPRDLESRTVQTPAPPPREEVSRAERRLQEMLSRERDDEDSEQDPQATQKAQREREARLADCASARRDLGVLQFDRPVYRTDESGNRIYLEDDQRARQIADAQERVKHYCR